MNRKNEFEAMIEELNWPAPGLETTLDRAYKKKRKRATKRIVPPAVVFTACFGIFVLLVNFYAPVAYACSQIPVLRELAAAVTFSRSLTDAVENEYAQTVGLSRTENGITGEIAYLIVDQKQVNIFYRLNSDKYERLTADPDIKCEDKDVGFCVVSNSFGQENGELLSITVDFTQGNVPDKLQCTLRVYSYYAEDADYLAELAFTLKFDPKYTASGKVFPVNETVILDGQAITVTNIEVYPTHMRVEIAESEENTAWLKDLDFYIETDGGMKFDPVSNGITATGSADSPSMVSYRADSTYFYEAEHLKLVITGAKWLRKDMKTTYLNLVTGEHGELPAGTAFTSAERSGNDWTVRFRVDLEEDGTINKPFWDTFFDADGNAYAIKGWGSVFGEANTYCCNVFTLKNYSRDEVWFTPQYSHTWVAEDQIVIAVQ